MREKLIFILLVASLNTYAQRRNDTIFCGIPKLTASDLMLKKNLANSNSDPLVLISGNPGPATTIRIRCISTVQPGNEPLYIVDGILYESKQIKSIKPDDIEMIDILKSPAAEGVYGCRALNRVVIITTKKFYDKKFVIKDAKDRLGIGYATISASSLQTGNSFSFVANEFGRIETIVLKSMDYKLTITCAGYKTKQVLLKEVARSKYEILLERDVIDLREIIIFPSCIRRCSRKISFIQPVDSLSEFLSGSLRCLSYGIKINEEKKQFGHLSNEERQIKIHPNPASSLGTINISFPNVKAGVYQIRLLNATGQLFYSFQKQISGKNETEQIHLNSRMIPGIYLVQIIDAQKKLLQTGQLIVQ